MVDLHLHTNNSDGDLSTLELLKTAENKKAELISITDHNNINAYTELNEIRQIYKGKIIPGIELEFVYDGILMDMLGYGIDLNQIKETEIIKKGLIHTTIETESENLIFYKSICDKLGIKYSQDLKVVKANYMANDVIADDILTYEENKGKLDKLGIVDRGTFYRKHVLKKESPFFVDFTTGKFDIFYVTKVIHEAGGKCFLAHPFAYDLDDLVKFLDCVVSLNVIDGIECYHRKHTKERVNFLIDYCDKHKLLKSGGSDFHTLKHTICHSDNGNIEINKNIVYEWINEIELI